MWAQSINWTKCQAATPEVTLAHIKRAFKKQYFSQGVTTEAYSKVMQVTAKPPAGVQDMVNALKECYLILVQKSGLGNQEAFLIWALQQACPARLRGELANIIRLAVGSEVVDEDVPLPVGLFHQIADQLLVVESAVSYQSGKTPGSLNHLGEVPFGGQQHQDPEDDSLNHIGGRAPGRTSGKKGKPTTRYDKCLLCEVFHVGDPMPPHFAQNCPYATCDLCGTVGHTRTSCTADPALLRQQAIAARARGAGQPGAGQQGAGQLGGGHHGQQQQQWGQRQHGGPQQPRAFQQQQQPFQHRQPPAN
jgi:hypothetical protein